MQDLLALLPSVDRVLDLDEIREAEVRWGRSIVRHHVRAALEALRGEIRDGRLDAAALRTRLADAALAASIVEAVERALEPRPRRVINATGVVVHTNLGRSILSPAAAARVAEAASGYLDLEYDLARGRRGSRGDHLAPLLDVLFPGRAFVAVNNNAAAISLALRALARRKEVVVSRGELVEIGGSFRVPDILAASGARLREVGTTNRTRRTDYEEALGPRTGAILKVHTSNFRIVGFTEETGVAELADVARGRGVPLIVDWGSGDLVDLAPYGIDDETPVSRILEDGADLVTFSGDKLLGGPQAGFAVGRPELVAKLRRDPMARICRLDRLQIAALHETLAAYVRGRAEQEVPTLAMIARDAGEIGARAERVRSRLTEAVPGLETAIADGVSRTGGGSSPTGERPTRLLVVDVGPRGAARLERRLRAARPAVVARVSEGRVLFDLRTVDPADDDALASVLAEALSSVRR